MTNQPEALEQLREWVIHNYREAPASPLPGPLPQGVEESLGRRGAEERPLGLHPRAAQGQVPKDKAGKEKVKVKVFKSESGSA